MSLRRRTEIFLAILTLLGVILNGFSIYPYSHMSALWFEIALTIVAAGFLTDLPWAWYICGAICLCIGAIAARPILSAPAAVQPAQQAAATEPQLTQSVVAPPTFRSRMVARPEAGIAFGGIQFAASGIPIVVGGFSGQPFRIHIGADGKLVCDVTTYSIRTARVIEIRDNVISPLPAGWDMNSNRDGMEVVNEKYQPVFQMYYESPTLIRISGIIISPPAVLLATRETTQMISFQDPYLADAIESFSLPRFFKYPSKMFPGVPN